MTLVVNLGIAVVLARELGASGRGTLAVAMSFAMILVQLGTLGLATANPYFAASGQAPIAHLVSNSLWSAGLVGLVLSFVGVALNVWFPSIVGGVDWPTLLIALSMVPALLAMLFLQSLLLGEGRMVAYSGLEVGQGAATLLGLLVAFQFYDLSVTAALGVMALAAYGAVVALLILLRAHGPFAGGLDVSLARSLLGYGLKVYVAALVGFLVLRLDVLLVNGFLGSADAGVYAVVAGLAEGMYLLPAVIGINLFARIARSEPSAMTAEVFRSMVVLYGIVCLLSVPLAAPAIDILFGPEFSEAVELYYFILPGIYCLGLVTILSNHFAGRGFPISAVLAWVAGLVVNVLLNVLLLDSRGLYIASVASTVAYLIVLVLFMRLFQREIGGWRHLAPRPQEAMRFVRGALTPGRPA
jgi:O-antigen/teichoic acid export membrane protein